MDTEQRHCYRQRPLVGVKENMFARHTFLVGAIGIILQCTSCSQNAPPGDKSLVRERKFLHIEMRRGLIEGSFCTLSKERRKTGGRTFDHSLYKELVEITTNGFLVALDQVETGRQDRAIIFFPYEQTTRTQALGWTIVGTYVGGEQK